MIEQGKVAMAGKTCMMHLNPAEPLNLIKSSIGIELGAGTGLVSLVSASSRNPPLLIVMTDYPDQVILGNLRSNIEHNQNLFTKGCYVAMEGYEWGKTVQHIKSVKHLIDIFH